MPSRIHLETKLESTVTTGLGRPVVSVGHSAAPLRLRLPHSVAVKLSSVSTAPWTCVKFVESLEFIHTESEALLGKNFYKCYPFDLNTLHGAHVASRVLWVGRLLAGRRDQ